jgi:hypothetical protein
MVSVKDNGVGIPPDKLDAVFEMFAQIDPSLTRSQDGLGIGLTLVKQLVHQHGGSVEALSAGLGQGSEFRVRLPVLADALQAETAPAPLQKADTARRRILVVDDNKDIALALAELLAFDDHETALA